MYFSDSERVNGSFIYRERVKYANCAHLSTLTRKILCTSMGNKISSMKSVWFETRTHQHLLHVAHIIFSMNTQMRIIPVDYSDKLIRISRFVNYLRRHHSRNIKKKVVVGNRATLLDAVRFSKRFVVFHIKCLVAVLNQYKHIESPVLRL